MADAQTFDTKTSLFDKAAVLEALPDHPAIKAILAWNPDALTDAKLDRGEVTLTMVPECIRAAAGIVRDAGYNAFPGHDRRGLVSLYSALSTQLSHLFARL